MVCLKGVQRATATDVMGERNYLFISPFGERWGSPERHTRPRSRVRRTNGELVPPPINKALHDHTIAWECLMDGSRLRSGEDLESEAFLEHVR